ncbi:hypothetical protein ACTMTF_29625 [Nonomuraea sp. ZG12]|uniref:hypothetical protein n=1 Tax=Nonomuraea sp. ZG12 TaxID=3452207 RepID=UPI003F8B772F
MPRMSLAAVCWLAAYCAVHVWWAVAGAPVFASFGESFIPGRWPPVALSALAMLACLLMARPRAVPRAVPSALHPWPPVVLGWVAGVGMIAYSFMFALDIVGMLFANPLDRVGFLIRGAGVAGGVLTLLCAIAAQRRARRACPRCGRVHGRTPERRTDPSPAWAFLAAYAAVAGCSARLVAQVGEWPWDVTEPAVVVFLVLYAAAGTLLPLALVHRWGRIWPRWVPPLAGREVPRWLVLVPAFLVGGGLAGYFGVVGLTETLNGGLGADLGWALAVISGYTVWGAGLLVAATSYVIMTKPPCPDFS